MTEAQDRPQKGGCGRGYAQQVPHDALITLRSGSLRDTTSPHKKKTLASLPPIFQPVGPFSTVGLHRLRYTVAKARVPTPVPPSVRGLGRPSSPPANEGFRCPRTAVSSEHIVRPRNSSRRPATANPSDSEEWTHDHERRQTPIAQQQHQWHSSRSFFCYGPFNHSSRIGLRTTHVRARSDTSYTVNVSRKRWWFHQAPGRK